MVLKPLDVVYLGRSHKFVGTVNSGRFITVQVKDPSPLVVNSRVSQTLNLDLVYNYIHTIMWLNMRRCALNISYHAFQHLHVTMDNSPDR